MKSVCPCSIFSFCSILGRTETVRNRIFINSPHLISKFHSFPCRLLFERLCHEQNENIEQGQTQKTTPMNKKGREKERFIILVFYVVFKHTEDIYPLLFYTKSFRDAKIIQTKVKTNSSGIYLVSFVSTIGTKSISIS